MILCSQLHYTVFTSAYSHLPVYQMFGTYCHSRDVLFSLVLVQFNFPSL